MPGKGREVSHSRRGTDRRAGYEFRCRVAPLSRGGDANRDGVVDFNDLVKLAQNYNTTGKTWGDGDFTGDGNVDFNDLVVLAQRYNTSLPATPAPVPSAFSFAADWAATTAVAPLPVSNAIEKKKINPKPIFCVRSINLSITHISGHVVAEMDVSQPCHAAPEDRVAGVAVAFERESRRGERV